MPAARIRDVARRVGAALTTPLLPDDYTKLLNPLWTARELRGRIEAVIPETEDAATLVIRPGWGWSFNHQPGQFVGIGVDVGGRWHWRSYSLTSPPQSDEDTITITVKAMPEGFLSEHLVRGLEPGTVVRLAQPSGEFVLPDPPPAKMLRTLDRRGTLPHIVHIHSAPSEKSFLFADELAALAERHADSDDRGYRLHTNLDDRDGIFTLDRLDEVCPDWRERQSWVCGPPPMLEAAEEFWKDNDLEDRLHIERFQPAGFQAGESEAGGTVTFATSNKTAEVDGATTLLEAGEELGIGMPYGCRMGICHTCTLTLVEGRAIDLRNGEQHEGPNTKIQTCVSAVAGNCTLDI